MSNYLGGINEIKMGASSKLPPKPGILSMVEMCETQGIPLVAGGVVDQPVIWLHQYREVIELKKMFEAMSPSQ